MLHLKGRENSFGNTLLTACKCCGKRVFGLAAEIHWHEYHSGAVMGDVCEEVVKQMKEREALTLDSHFQLILLFVSFSFPQQH